MTKLIYNNQKSNQVLKIYAWHCVCMLFWIALI